MNQLADSMILLTHNELEQIATAIEQKQPEIQLSTSLGRWAPKRARINGCLIQIDGELFDFSRVAYDRKSVYRLENGSLKKIQFFSEETNKLYKLVPTSPLPTLAISGVYMHRLADGGPKADNLRRMRRLQPLKNRLVLDTCLGLGYTAVEAAQACKAIYAFERDVNVIEIARINPYSWEMFHSNNIHITIGDIYEEIENLEDAFFDRILHDPPTFSLAGELYSRRFYEQLYRVLRPKGILLHYTGAPGSKKRGRDLPAEVMKRLNDVGFRNVARAPEVLGVIARRF